MWYINLHCITGKSFIKIGPPIWGKERGSQAKNTPKISPKEILCCYENFPMSKTLIVYKKYWKNYAS